MGMVIQHNMMAANSARALNSHYQSLATSTQRLSSGLRINAGEDDAAGLAIRELQRADISTMRQGMRNANDAISMIQTADGALQIIDEKLIRMKELSEQAATGTYDSTQRLMIDSEFQKMAAEIQRIATSTEFNGMKLLDGSRDGAHDGSGINSAGAMKIHFGTSNNSAEDYYYAQIPPADILGLNLGGFVNVQPAFPPGTWSVAGSDTTTAANAITGSGITLTQPAIHIGAPDSIGVFTNGQGAGMGPPMQNGLILSSGKVKDAMNPPGKKASTALNTAGDADLTALAGNPTHDASILNLTFTTTASTLYFNFVFASEEYPNYVGQAFNDVCGIFMDGVNFATMENVSSVDMGPVPGSFTGPISLNNIFNSTGSTQSLFVNNQSGANSFVANGFTRTFRIGIPVTPGVQHTLSFRVADVKDSILDSWIMVNDISTQPQSTLTMRPTVNPLDIQTQAKAQFALDRISGAIVAKDSIRAHLGALQNRLENTISNLNIQAENLQVAESRISDVDVATEMTDFVRSQILSQASVAMLAQANSLPKMAQQIIGG